MNISFFHGSDPSIASYRYRAQIPAQALGASLNDASADVWIVAKPDSSMECLPAMAKERGKLLITDVCDAHLERPIYQHLIRESDAVTTCTPYLANLIQEDCCIKSMPTVILDPYEAPESAPHVQGANFLWFGHGSNFYSMYRYLPSFEKETLHILTKFVEAEGLQFLPWSLEQQWHELAWADCVLIPETAPYKSANRAIEAIRAGCFVVAEPHPSLMNIPGIWIGNLMKGAEWLKDHPAEANRRLIESQAYVREKYSPERVANAWRTLLTALRSNSVAGKSDGEAGLALTDTDDIRWMSSPIYGPFPFPETQPTP